MKGLFQILYRLTAPVLIVAASGLNPVYPQAGRKTDVYLLTCFPGKDIETIHGHSAIRITDHFNGTDSVYNWGVYDFRDPYFILKFLKGRLIYRVTGYSFSDFTDIYRHEERDVLSQKINLSDSEKQILTKLIQVNLQPENRYYLYNFFHDNCATRIRDLLEKTLGTTLIYPGDTNRNKPTFRSLADEAQFENPWLTLVRICWLEYQATPGLDSGIRCSFPNTL